MKRGTRIGIIAIAVAAAAILVILYARHVERFPGTDDAYVEADVVAIVAQVAGPIVNLAVEDNQSVNAGDLLFEIDPRPFRIAVEKAHAQLDKTGQNVSGLADDVTSADAYVRNAQANLRLAEVQWKRIEPLAKMGAVPFQDKDKAEAGLAEARAALADAEAKRKKALSDLGAVGIRNVDIRTALAELEYAELQLSYTRVLAPVNGYVTDLTLSPGSYASVGSPILSLVNTDSWRVVAYMKETQLRLIRPGQQTRVYLPAYPGVRFTGLVQGIGWGVEQQDSEGELGPDGVPSVSPTVDWVRMAQRFPVRISFVKPDPAHPLRKGMRSAVRIDASADVASDDEGGAAGEKLTDTGNVMAQAVRLSAFPRAVRWIARPSPAVRYGLKLGTAMTAAVWIAFASALSWGLTIWITVMFVAQPNTGASFKKGLLRVSGSVAAALISIAIYGLFAQQPPLMLASLCGVLVVAVYGMTGPRYQYAWLVFGFTTILILVKAMAGSDQIETLSFERSTLTALGLLIVLVADGLFWPVRAEEQLRGSLAERSRQLGDTLKQHLENFSTQQAPDGAGPAPSSPLIQQLGLVDQFRDEIGATPQRVQGLSRVALLLEGLASRVRLLERDAEREQSFPAQGATLDRLGESLNAALAEAAHCLAADRAPEPFAEALEHSLAGFGGEQTARLDSLVRQGAPGRRETEQEALLSALAFVLKDVVLVLRRLEEALLGLVKQDGEPTAEQRASEAAPRATVKWFHPDPIRLQLGLRAGIAGGGVLVAMLVMGWDLEDDVLPMIMAPIVAFILAGMSSTRGAGKTVGIGLASGVLLGWLIADLASVYLFDHLGRMPLSLVYPFVIAGGAGYLIVRGSPLGPLGALFGLLTALLPIYIGDQPPHNVDTAYGLVCGILLGEAAGLIAQRFLWPRTAMQIFTQRAAAQLDLCLQALGERDTEGGAPVRDAVDLASDYAKQLTMLGQLHAQAHAEPIERTLDDTRRAELLALLQEIFDASLRTRKWVTENEAGATQDATAALAQLHEALTRHDEALVASLKSAAEALRGSGPAPDSSLAEARAAVDAQIDALRGRADLASAPDPGRFGEILAHVAAGRRLVDSQLQLEAWLTAWNQAIAGAANSAPPPGTGRASANEKG